MSKLTAPNGVTYTTYVRACRSGGFEYINCWFDSCTLSSSNELMYTGHFTMDTGYTSTGSINAGTLLFIVEYEGVINSDLKKLWVPYFGEKHPETYWNSSCPAENIYYIKWKTSESYYHQWSSRPWFVQGTTLYGSRSTFYQDVNDGRTGTNNSSVTLDVTTTTIEESSHFIPGLLQEYPTLWADPVILKSVAMDYPSTVFTFEGIGNADDESPITTIEIYMSTSQEDIISPTNRIGVIENPKSNVIQLTGLPYGQRYFFCAQVIREDGSTFQTSLVEALLCNIGEYEVVQKPSMSTALGAPHVGYYNDKYYVLGGFLASSSYSDAISEYDEETGTLTRVGTLPYPLYYGASTQMGKYVYWADPSPTSSPLKGKILRIDLETFESVIVGDCPLGASDSVTLGVYKDELWSYIDGNILRSPDGGASWVLYDKIQLPKEMRNHHMAIIDGCLYTGGGWNITAPLLMCYDIEKKQVYTTQLTHQLYDAIFVTLGGEVYVIGGREYTSTISNRVYRFNQLTKGFELSSLSVPYYAYGVGFVQHEDRVRLFAGMTSPLWDSPHNWVYDLIQTVDRTEPDPTLCPRVTDVSISFDIKFGKVHLVWNCPTTHENFASIQIRMNTDTPALSVDEGRLVYEAFGDSLSEYLYRVGFEQKLYFSFFTLNAEGRYASPVTISVDTTRLHLSFPKKFTPAGATYNVGPTQEQLEIAYQGTSLEGLVTSAAGIQKWIVPATGVYKLTARGANGGCGGDYGTTGGGRGAEIAGTCKLTKGQVLYLLVGQSGQDAPGDSDGGGGGGSFIVVEDINSENFLTYGSEQVAITPLLIAGGGGGVSADGRGYDASLTEESTGLTVNTKVGYGSDIGNGAGGGGFLTGGKDGPSCYGGPSFLSGGAGASGTRRGGFGCGASGYDEYGAGGGGYTGGPGYDNSTYASGGGGCFVAEQFSEVTKQVYPLWTTGEITIEAVELALTGIFALTEEQLPVVIDPDTDEWMPLPEGELLSAYATDTLSWDKVQSAKAAGYKIYKYTTAQAGTNIPLEITGMPAEANCITTTAYDVHRKTIMGIHIETATSECELFFSTDGVSWQIFDGSNWVTSQKGMDAAEINNMGRPAWDLLPYTDMLYIKAKITPGTYTPVKLENIKLRYCER